MMSHHAEQPEFLQKLTDAQAAVRHRHSSKQHGNEVLQESWWEVSGQHQTSVTGSTAAIAADAAELDPIAPNSEAFLQVRWPTRKEVQKTTTCVKMSCWRRLILASFNRKFACPGLPCIVGCFKDDTTSGILSC